MQSDQKHPSHICHLKKRLHVMGLAVLGRTLEGQGIRKPGKRVILTRCIGNTSFILYLKHRVYTPTGWPEKCFENKRVFIQEY